MGKRFPSFRPGSGFWEIIEISGLTLRGRLVAFLDGGAFRGFCGIKFQKGVGDLVGLRDRSGLHGGSGGIRPRGPGRLDAGLGRGNALIRHVGLLLTDSHLGVRVLRPLQLILFFSLIGGADSPFFTLLWPLRPKYQPMPTSKPKPPRPISTQRSTGVSGLVTA